MFLHFALYVFRVCIVCFLCLHRMFFAIAYGLIFPAGVCLQIYLFIFVVVSTLAVMTSFCRPDDCCGCCAMSERGAKH